METLRIQAPAINMCESIKCFEYTRESHCHKCVAHEYRNKVLNTWVRKEVATTALPSKPKVIHSLPFRGDLSC